MNARLGFAYVYGFLTVALAVAAFSAGLMGPWKAQEKPVTIVQTVTPRTAEAVAAAWGKPDERVAGTTVNAAFSHLTCDLWTAKAAVLCF